MQDGLKKLMEAKKGQPLDPRKKDAKMSMLKALKDEMSGMMKEDLQKPGLKKVEVAASDKSGLVHGLDKAKDLLDADEQLADAGEHEMYDVSPEMEEEAEEGDSMEPEMHAEGGLSPEEEQLLQLLLKKRK